MLRKRKLLIVTLATCGTLIFLAANSSGYRTDQDSQEARLLEMNRRIERETVGEQVHNYKIYLDANDFLQVIVDQQGVDVVVTVYAPDGKKLLDVDSPNGPQGPEPVLLIAELAGTYRLEVRSLDKALSGKYAVSVAQKHPAQIKDREQIAERERVNNAQDLVNQADSLRAQGRYDEGLPLVQRALKVFEEAMGSENLYVANALNSLGLLYEVKGDYATAESTLMRALAIGERTLGPDHNTVAGILHNLAGVADAKGDLAQEERLEQRSFSIFKNVLGGQHPQVAIGLNALGRLYYSKGDYIKAESLYGQALAINEKALGPEHPEVAIVLNNIAELYYAKGDYAEAESRFKRTLLIREKVLGPNHPDVAVSLHNLGELYRHRGKLVMAQQLHQRALAIRERTLGPNHPHVADSLNRLAQVSLDDGNYARAEEMFKRALAIHQKAFGKEHHEVATDLDNLAVVYQDRGKYTKAETLHNQALAMYQKTLGPDHPRVADTLYNLSIMYNSIRHYRQAIESLMRGQKVRESNSALILATGSENQKRLYLSTLVKETDYAVSLHLGSVPLNRRAARLAVTAILRQKGRALDAMADQIGALRRRALPQDQALFDQFVNALSQQARLQFLGDDRLDAETKREEIIKSAAQVEEYQREISRRSEEFRTEWQPNITLDRVRSVIPSDSVLVEIFKYRPYSAREIKKSLPQQYAAYLVRRDKPIPKFVGLGRADLIEADVAQLRAALRNPERSDVKELARKVDRRVMSRVRELIGKTQTVYLVPDGTTSLIPFEALVDENGKYLVENYSFTYLTSGRDLLRLQTTFPSKTPPVIVADPQFDLNLAIPDGRQVADGTESRLSGEFGEKFIRLANTANEANDVAALLKGSLVLTGEAATETAVKRVRSPSVLHMATHAFFLPNLIRETESPSMSGVENPLLHSGLALAGANTQRGGNGEDGILTALEASGLDLWGTKLIVLSACETGLGDLRREEGVYGLRRALVLAGAESQVMSLWKVDDEVTRDLMVAYYQQLKAGDGRSQALRKVQRQMLKSREQRHPYYWASFVQSGDSRRMDPITMGR